MYTHQIGNRPPSSMSYDNRTDNNNMLDAHRIIEGRLTTPDAEKMDQSSSSSSLHNNNNNQHPTSIIIEEPTLSAEELFTKLHEALSLEPKFQANLFLPQDSQVSTFYFHFFFICVKNSHLY